MMEQLKSMKGESGALIIEATWAILMSIIILAMILSLGFYMFQVTSLKILANDIAQEIAQTYKFENVEDATNLTKDDVKDVPKYRYLNGKARESENEDKGREIAVEQGGLTAMNGLGRDTRVTVKTESDDLGRRHHEVTVSQDYNILLGGFLSIMGIDSAEVLSATAYSQGVDMLNYCNVLKTTQYGVSEFMDLTRLTGLVDSILGLISSFTKVIF